VLIATHDLATNSIVELSQIVSMDLLIKLWHHPHIENQEQKFSRSRIYKSGCNGTEKKSLSSPFSSKSPTMDPTTHLPAHKAESFLKRTSTNDFNETNHAKRHHKDKQSEFSLITGTKKPLLPSGEHSTMSNDPTEGYNPFADGGPSIQEMDEMDDRWPVQGMYEDDGPSIQEMNEMDDGMETEDMMSESDIEDVPRRFSPRIAAEDNFETYVVAPDAYIPPNSSFGIIFGPHSEDRPQKPSGEVQPDCIGVGSSKDTSTCSPQWCERCRLLAPLLGYAPNLRVWRPGGW
jgi:hypothetical protein